MTAVTRGLLALLAALLAGPAFAAPTLRAEALVTSQIVTLGDLVDGAGDKADVAVFRAPDLGQTGAVPAAVVIAAARRAGLADVSAGGVVEVAVARLAREIAADEAFALVAARAADALRSAPEAVRVAFDEAGPWRLDPSAAGALELRRFVMDPATGRFEATFAAAGQPATVPARRLSGQAVETVETVALVRSLARGDLVSVADLVVERRPRAEARDALDLAGAKGLAARRALREGQPLRAGDLMRPQHVDRGALVTLIYMAGGMSLSLKAKALQAGAAGDVVSVQNLQSKRAVTGVVTGPSEVTVTAAPTAVARR